MKYINAAARAAFFVTIFLIPMRMRAVILARPGIQYFSDYTDFLLFTSDMALLLTLILWAVMLIAGRKLVRFGPRYLWVSMLGLILAGWLSVSSSKDPVLSKYLTIRLFILFLFYLYVLNKVTSLTWVLIPVAIQGVFQSVVVVLQSIAQRSIGLQTMGEIILHPANPGVSIVSTGSERFLRAYGLSDHPNILGGCLAFGLVLLLSAFIHENRNKKLLVGSAFLPTSIGLLLTFSRSAWLAFLAGSALIVGVEVLKREWKSLRPVLWLGLVTLLVLVPFIWKDREYLRVRLNASNSFDTVPAEEQSIGERGLLARSAWSIFPDHWLTGVGLGASALALRDSFPDFPVAYQPPHLTPLAAFLETGIAGGIFYLLLLFLPWLALFRQRLILADPKVIAVAGLLLAITLVGFFDHYTWSSNSGRLWQWLAWGLWAGTQKTA